MCRWKYDSRRKRRCGRGSVAAISRPGSIDQAYGQQRHHGRGNAAGYDNREAFQVIDRLATTADPEEVDALYRRLTEIYRIDPPFTRLFPFTRDWFVHRRIRGLSTPFRATPPDKFMETLWVEEPE